MWGDDTMLNGRHRRRAHRAPPRGSRSSRSPTSSPRGGTDVTLDEVTSYFPTQVQSNGDHDLLADWHAVDGELWNLCRSDQVFNSTETWAFGGGSYLMPTMGVVSVDQSSSWAPPGDTAPVQHRATPERPEAPALRVGLSPTGRPVEMNGSTDLSSCVVGNSGARLYSVKLAKQSGALYDYVFSVEAQGPKGLGSGWLYLYFTDRTGDRYSLGIWKSERLLHTVAYNSADPGIVKIEWGS